MSSSLEPLHLYLWMFWNKHLKHLLHTPGTMPYHDEEYPGQPLWQSVLLFCCKGMIEGIMVLLFFWLLVQVLFTKQLEGMTLNYICHIYVANMLTVCCMFLLWETKTFCVTMKSKPVWGISNLTPFSGQPHFVLLQNEERTRIFIIKYCEYGNNLLLWPKLAALTSFDFCTDKELWILSSICPIWIRLRMCRN